MYVYNSDVQLQTKADSQLFSCYLLYPLYNFYKYPDVLVGYVNIFVK